MARIFMAGNETGDYTAEWSIFSGSPTSTTNQLGGRRTAQNNGGRYYYYLNASTNLNILSRVLPNVATGAATGGYSEIYGRVAYGNLNASTAKDIIHMRNSATGLTVGKLRMIDTGSPTFRIDGVNAANSAFASSGFSKNLTTTNSQFGGFMRLEWHFKCAASGGIFELWIDDQLAFSATGLNTSNGSTVVFDQILIGQTDQTGQLNGFDDIAINDLTGTVNNGRVGEGVILGLYPARAGLFSQLTNDYGTSQENADHINKPPVDSLGLTNPNGFVGANSTGLKDSYKLPSLPGEFGGISAVKSMAYAVRNGPSLSNLKFLLEPGYPAPTTAPSVSVLALSGNVDIGAHQYVVTFVGDPAHVGGESLQGPASSVATTSSGNQQVSLTNIPLGPTTQTPSPATARKIYRTKAGAPGVYFLLTTINDNTTTTFTDNVADSSLGAGPPVEIASSNIALPVGAFGWIENIFNHNTNTGNAWTPAELEAMELGLQFNT